MPTPFSGDRNADDLRLFVRGAINILRMKNLDSKSALLGLAVGVLLTLTLGAATSGINSIGRFQVAGTASHGIIVDTQTGRAWTIFLSQNGGNSDAEFKKAKTE
jgi:hypothetical protein